MSNDKATGPTTPATDAARQAMADFLANMSHEIRTPLNAIIGMAYLVLQSKLDVSQREYVGKIEAAGQHLLGIVNEMLDYTRLEAGEITLSRAVFDPANLLDETVRRFGDKALAKRLRIVGRVATSVPVRLIGDPVRIGQILGYYIGNAIKFTEQGEVEITLTADGIPAGMPPTCRLDCAVRDTGIGLDEGHRSDLFQAFRQADGSSTRKFGGTGLGLAIARKLAELMDGRVGVDSEPGKGSTFSFSVRLELDPETPRPGQDHEIVIEPPVADVAARSGVAVDPERLAAAASSLLALLAEDDAEAGEVFKTNADLLRVAWPTDFPRLEQAIRDFDFSQALNILKRACGDG